ncbi:MAG: addiction module toxin RelE [Muribaculaceae bacterium]|nr:addiction module toxin RelE [Muribaculaceae bacterium]
MSFEIKTTPEFERQAKPLNKRYRSFKSDLKNLILSLQKNPFQGVELKPGIRKIRLAITSKGKGKSGGVRIITYTVLTSIDNGSVFLMNIYDKSDFSSIKTSMIEEMIQHLDIGG